MSDIIRVSDQFKAALEARETAAFSQMADAYVQLERRLLADYELLLTEIAEKGISPSRAHTLKRYKDMMRQLFDEQEQYAQFVTQIISNEQSAAIDMALQETYATTEAAAMRKTPELAAELMTQWNQIPFDALEAMVGFAGDGSPLMPAMVQRFGSVAPTVNRTLQKGLALGWHPTKIVKNLRGVLDKGLLGNALTWARTETIRASREAGRRSYEANPHIVKGWTRHATLDERTCFVAGTLIDTPSGKVPIESVQVGDSVQSHSGVCLVTCAISKEYFGNLVEVYTTGGKLFVCTPEHVVWARRGEKWSWMPAIELTTGDDVVVSKHADELVANGCKVSFAVPFEMQDGISLPSEFGVAPFFFGGVLMPIHTVGFKGNASRNNKVNGVRAGRNLAFKRNAKVIKNSLAGYFKRGISSVCSIAMRATESVNTISEVRLYSELLATIGTFNHVNRATAFFRAIVAFMVRGVCKHLATPLACNIFGICGATLDTTVIKPIRLTGKDGEFFTTRFAGFRSQDSSIASKIAFPRTVFSRARRATKKRLAAVLAHCFNLGSLGKLRAFFATVGSSSSSDIRWGASEPLTALGTMVDRAHSVLLRFHVCAAAGARTKFSAATLNSRRGLFECGSALQASTGNWHVDSISHVARRVKSQTRVYDLETESHTYFAGGILVHNCAACIALDGKFYPMNADGSCPSMDDHIRGRCSMLPETASYSDILGVDVPEGPVGPYDVGDIPTGRQYIEGLPEAQQRAYFDRELGKGGYDAWKSGKFGWDDIPKLNESAEWGNSWTVQPKGKLWNDSDQ